MHGETLKLVYVTVFLFSWSVMLPVLLQPEFVTAVTVL